MSKKYKQYLQTLSADHVAKKLGNWCEDMGRIMTDKETGTVSKLLTASIVAFNQHCNNLLEVAAEKNGVAKGIDKNFEKTLEAIAVAVEARGSQSAVQIRSYVELVKKAKQAANRLGYNETKNPIKAMRLGAEGFKLVG